MPDSSKAVLQDGKSNVRSALVKAFESWAEPFDIKPNGVFGSVATITSGAVSISSETLDIEFEVPFDDDMEPNEAEIVIYNISDGTINQLKNGAEISIEAGYKGDTGVLFKGFISKVKVDYEDADRVVTIKALDDIKSHSIESLSFSAGTKASYILKTLIQKTGIPVAVFKVQRDHTYEDSQTVDGDLMKNIKDYAAVCGISVYVSKGKIYARHIKEGDALNFTLSADTGLIGSPRPFTEEVKAEDFVDTINGYEADTLLQYRISTGAIINLKGKRANGTYRVCSGRHSFSNHETVTSIKMY